MVKLIIVRHGESVWNLENRFTGAMDIPLSKKGKEESKKAGEVLKGQKIDIIFVSHMIRAMDTLYILLEHYEDHRTPIIYHYDDQHLLTKEHAQIEEGKELKIIQSRAIDERYYGDLQGLNKDDCRKKYGEEQVHIWRRSFDVRPPGGESLKDTIRRVMPFYNKYIAQELKSGKNVLVVAHGNSLRAMIKHIETIPDADIPNYELGTGVPIVYEMDENLKIISKKELR